MAENGPCAALPCDPQAETSGLALVLLRVFLVAAIVVFVVGLLVDRRQR